MQMTSRSSWWKTKPTGRQWFNRCATRLQGFVEVNPEGGKISRAAAASPQLESGNWYLPHPELAPWVDGFISECAVLPAGVNDDQVDAWSQGAKRLMAVVSKRPRQAPPQRHARERSWMSN